MNTSEKIKNYKQKGYFICNINRKKITNLRKTFVKTFNLISTLILKKKIKNDEDIVNDILKNELVSVDRSKSISK